VVTVRPCLIVNLLGAIARRPLARCTGDGNSVV
jgi:hypothetical protein